uniref:Fibronectin type-III domain-containing protein n=1 Tax=viral metagenome TaxID=1070528 RepID=A0A6C0DQK9_9ZZZZ
MSNPIKSTTSCKSGNSDSDYYAVSNVGKAYSTGRNGNGMVQTSDYGATWSTSSVSFNQAISLVCSSDGTKIVAFGQFSQIYYSSDSGSTWVNRDYSYVGYLSNGIANYNGDFSYWAFTIVNTNYYVYSTNLGVNWTTVTDTPFTGAGRMACNSSGSIVYNAAGSAYKSTDYGASWSAMSVPWSGEANSLSCSSDGTVIVAGKRNTNNIWYSSDSGNSWGSIGLVLRQWSTGPTRPFSVNISADGNTVLVAQDNFICSYSRTFNSSKTLIGTDNGINLVSGWTWQGGNLSPDGNTFILCDVGNNNYCQAWKFASVVVTTPSAPTIGTATAVGSGSPLQISVSFTGSTGATGYTVTSTTGSYSNTGTSSPIVVTVGSSTTSYSFTVTANNSAGTSGNSANSNGAYGYPNAPTIGTPSISGTTATVYWSAPSGGVSSYSVYYSNGTLIASSVSSSATSQTVTVTAGSTNSFYVVAVGGGSQSSTNSSTSSSVTAIPSAPTGVTASINGTTATVSFSVSTGATSYTATSTPGSLTGTGSSSGITISGLTGNTSYTFTVTATNSAGTSGSSNPSSAVVSPPTAPTAVSATATGPTTATVTFTAASQGTAYTISYTLSGGGSTVSTSSPYSVTGLTVSTRYTFGITAVANSVSSSTVYASAITTSAVVSKNLPPTNYLVNISGVYKDLSGVFAAYGGGTQATATGIYTLSGSTYYDLNAVFAPYTSGTKAAATNIYANNIDLCNIFAIYVASSSDTASQPSTTATLYARYTASNYNSTTNIWSDSTTNARNIPSSQITNTGLSLVTTTANTNGATKAFSVLQGSTSSKIQITNSIMTNYTLFTVARYTGGSRNRIFDGTTDNWLSGFWYGNTGCAYHEGWLAGYSDIYGNNWILSSDSYGTYRSNGTSRGSGAGGLTYMPVLSINNGRYSAGGGEASDFQVADVLIYDSYLTQADITIVENYLASLYGITIPS